MRRSREGLDNIYDEVFDSENPPSRCVNAKSTVSTLAFHLFDFLRTYTTILFLCGQYADQVTLQLARCGEAPLPKIQDSWKTSLSMMGSSALAAIIAKAINAYYSNCGGRYVAAQDYIYALFSSSVFFTLLALLSSSGHLPEMSQIAFIAISSTGVLLAMAIFLKLVTPISSNEMIDVTEAAKEFPNVSRLERSLNAVGSVSLFASLATFLKVSNDVVRSGSALVLWQKIFLAVGAIASALFGAKTITDHPKSYLYFFMTCIFLNSSAMSYSGYSNLLVANKVQEQEFLTALGAMISTIVGSFSAVMSQCDLTLKHESNVAVKEMVESSCDKIGALFHRLRNCGKIVPVEPDHELLEVTAS